MKRILLLAVGFFVGILSANAQVYFSEDFENTGLAAGDTLNMPGWITDTIKTISDTGGYHQTFWILGSYYNYFAKITSYKNSDTTETWLITPEIILPSTTTYLGVDVAMGYAYDATVDDQLRIMVTTDTTVDSTNFTSASWDTLEHVFTDPDAVGGYGSFKHYSFDLSKYANDTIRIAFVYNGNYGRPLVRTTTFEIDNIKVSTLETTDAFALDNYNVHVAFSIPITDLNITSSMFTLDGQVADTLFVDSINAPDIAVVNFATPAAIDNKLDTLLFANPQTGKNDTLVFYAGVLPLEYANSASSNVIQSGYKATFSGDVVYTYSNGALVMDGYGAFHGLLVYDAAAAGWTVGDSVIFTGYYSPFYGQQEVGSLVQYSVITSTINLKVDSAIVVNPAIFDIDSTSSNSVPQSYQNVLVHVDNINIYDSDTYGNYYGTSPAGDTLIFKSKYYNDANVAWTSLFTIGSTYNITGFVAYDYGHFRINPRNSGDVVEVVATKVDNSQVNNLAVYPNPAVNNITIEGEKMNNIQLYNAVGQLIRNFEVNTTKAVLNISDLPQGMYLLKVKTDEGLQTLRFIKR